MTAANPGTAGPASTTAADVATISAAANLVVAQFNAAWAAHDLTAAVALTSEDCVFETTGPPDGERCIGPEAIRAAWEPIFADQASAFTVEDTYALGSRVVQRWRYDWADGHVRGVDLFSVRDGKVAEKLAYVKG
jgi:hypothetical protein